MWLEWCNFFFSQQQQQHQQQHVYIKSVFSYKKIQLGGVVFRNYFTRADDVHYMVTVWGKCIFQNDFSDLILICKRKHHIMTINYDAPLSSPNTGFWWRDRMHCAT